MPLAAKEDASPAIEVLDAQKLPLELGEAPLSEGRSLTDGEAWNHLEFGFLYRERPFGVTAVREESTLRISLSALLGLIPFSAQNAGKRDDVLAALNGAPSCRHLRFEVAPTQQLFLHAEQALALPHTPIRILAAIAAIMDAAVPYLDRFSEMLPTKADEAH